MNFLPLWTASVWPTMSGRIVERRDHVFRTRFSPAAFIAVIFVRSGASTNGPFFVERDMCFLESLLAALDDHGVGALVVACLHALGLPAPRRCRMASSRGLALAAAHRVVDRVHRDAAVVRLPSEPAVAAGLADGNVLVLEVSDLADRGVAVHTHAPELARRHTEERVRSLLRHELSAGPRRAGHLAAAARLEFHVVHDRAERDRLQRKRVSDDDVDRRARDDRLADGEAGGRHDVPLLPVGVGEEGDARRPVRVVLDGGDLRRDVVLVALEVDVAIALLVTAAPPPGREVSAAVTAAGPELPARERLLRRGLRDLREVGRGPLAEAGRRGFVRLDGHGALHPFEEGRELLTFRQLHVGLLAVLGPADGLADLLDLPGHGDDADGVHLDLEEGLDGFADLDLVRVAGDVEREHVLRLAHRRRALGEDGAHEHGLQGSLAHASTSMAVRSASSEKTSVPAFRAS